MRLSAFQSAAPGCKVTHQLQWPHSASPRSTALGQRLLHKGQVRVHTISADLICAGKLLAHAHGAGVLVYGRSLTLLLVNIRLLARHLIDTEGVAFIVEGLRNKCCSREVMLGRSLVFEVWLGVDVGAAGQCETAGATNRRIQALACNDAKISRTFLPSSFSLCVSPS